MRVLLTGATGYFGAVAADALAARGLEVLGLAQPDGRRVCAAAATSTSS